MIPKKYLKYNPTFLTHGKRGEIYTFNKNKKKYALKIKRKESQAKNRISNEAKFLKILNKHNIGPKLIDFSSKYLLMEFVKGKPIKEHIKQTQNPNKILIQILNQCFILDQLKINKLEMHKPVKHILIYKNKGTLIDFERCYYTINSKNVTQFCEFINRLSKEFSHIRAIPKEEILTYKKTKTKEAFTLLIKWIGN